MFLVVRNKAVILSWAGGGQSSPPVQLWDDEEEEEEGILLFVAIKYKKKKTKEASVVDDDEEEVEEDEDVNNNSGRLTDSGIGEEREKSDGEEGGEARGDKGEVKLNSSEGGHKEESSGEKHEAFDEGKEGNRGGKNERIESTRSENIESSKGDECSDGPSLESKDGEDNCENKFLLQDEKNEKVGKESPILRKLADVVNNVKEAKSMEDEGNVTLVEEDLTKDREANEGKDSAGWVEKGQDGESKMEERTEDECDIKVVNRSKREGEACCSKRVTWKAEGGLEERLGGEQAQVRKTVRRSKSVESRGQGRGIAGEAGRGSESRISERRSGVEIGRAWERSLRLATGVRKSPEQRQLKSDGGGGAGRGNGGKRQDRSGERGEPEEGKGRVEGDWEEDGEGAGWRSLRRLRSKPHRPSSGR